MLCHRTQHLTPKTVESLDKLEGPYTVGNMAVYCTRDGRGMLNEGEIL